MLVQSYLFFEGRCDEALEFYQRALGARVEMVMRYRDSPDPRPDGAIPPGAEDKVMHASFRIGETTLMASDGRCSGTPNFQGTAQSISVADEAEADRIFTALCDGGTVVMPIGKTFFSPRFGMVTDRFGLTWMVIAA